MKAMKYLDIARELERDIYAGRYGPKGKLPTERELAKTFSAAHLTIREAIKCLIAKKLVTSKQGSGVYVSKTISIEEKLNPLFNGNQCVQILGMQEIASGHVNPVNWGIRMRLYQGISEAGYVLGLPASIMESSIMSDNRDELLESLKMARGLILIDLPLKNELVDYFLQLNIPIVQIGREDPSGKIDCILSDTVGGASLAVSHLLELGHQRIGFIGGVQTSTSMKQRFAGFTKAHKQAKVDYDPSLLLFNVGGLPADGAAAVEVLINRPDPPTAIFFASDYRAIGAVNRLHEIGIKIPNDISIVGYDNHLETAYTSPALTTVYNPLKEMGRDALKTLFLRLRNPERKPVTQVLPMHLVERDSTAPPLVL